MTVVTRTPQNTNFIQPTKYLLTFDRIGYAQYFCQDVNIPGVTMPQAPMSSPLHNYTIAGLNIKYDELRMTFIVDEQAQAWQGLYNWFLAISSPESFEERNLFQEKQNQYKPQSTTKFGLRSYSDATLTIMSNLNNPIMRVMFHYAFPTSLSSIEFSTRQSADEIITATATFAYEFFEFIPLDGSGSH